MRSEVLGASLQVQRPEGLIEIKLPAENDSDFENSDFQERVLLQKDSLVIDDKRFSQVYVLLVTVFTVAPAKLIDTRVESTARRVVTEFIDWCRIEGQTWLGFNGKRPCEIEEARRYIDEDTGKTAQFTESLTIKEVQEIFDSMGGRRVMNIWLDRVASAVDEGSLVLVAAKLSNLQTPALADQMLADAKYFADYPNPDPLRVLLFSAIACELKVKDVLLKGASDESRPLVELLLNHPRDYSMRVADLFDNAAKAVFARSLKHDDKLLFKKVSTLFEQRNKLAHAGTVPDDCPLTYIDTAVDAFTWLNKISKQITDPPVLLLRRT